MALDIPDFDCDFGEFSISLSPVEINSSQGWSCATDHSIPRVAEPSVHNALPETRSGIPTSRPDQPPLSSSSAPPPQYTAHDPDLTAGFEGEDEDLERAIALSKQTAEEEAKQRRIRLQQTNGVQSIGTDSVRLNFAPLAHVDATVQRPPFDQNPPQPQRPNSELRHVRDRATVSPLSTASIGNGGSSELDRSISRPTRHPSNQARLQRTPISTSPPPQDQLLRSLPKLEVPGPGQERRSSQSSGKLSIRDVSRSRSGSNAATSTRGSSGELCAMCQRVDSANAYCNACQAVYCERCWNTLPMHRRVAAIGELPHEKTDQYIAQKVKDVLTPNLNDSQREKLHEEDVDSTWFGVVRQNHELPLFRDYGRYATLIAGAKELRMDLMDSSSNYSDHSETLYPSLVSFVGETGAGKSTLIKLLVDLKSEPNEKFPTPVVGAPAKDVPTSEDVHLYLDPDSSMSVDSQAPLLFADCEGLDGGERDPIGARLKKRLERASGSGHRRRQLKHTSERELVWATEDRKKSRGFAVANLYPRLLYTFSDVIVFVLRNPRIMERVLERLVEWAQAALEKSSNQPVLPHVIIALNACENDTPEKLWDVETATMDVLAELSSTVYKNNTFRRLAQFWRDKNRQVDTVEQLLLSYYSSIHVVRIPGTGRPNLIQRQVEKLSEKIRSASKQARERKLELRMLLDADEFQPYLQVAFDHFAQDLDTPFDFVQASFTHSPIPNDFGGNILKLALQVMERWKNSVRGETIFEELSYVVASCIMLDAARSRNKGNPDAIFPMYLEHIDNALENFCDRHWPCEYVSKGGRCVNVRSGHGAKGHQLKSGKLLGAGEYFSTFTFDWYKSHFEALVYYKLISLWERVRKRATGTTPPISEEKAAADIHRELVLPNFFEHASKGNPQAFMSHTVCFCCLFEAPEHALPCGHIICTACLKTYGKLHLNRYVEIAECPMEKRQRFRHTWRVYLKPPTCGVRILTLDGGGIRGIVELEILRAIEKELGNAISIQSFFDLIVGTSTGGIIALGLTAGNWTVEECVTHFESLCFQAFTERKGSGIFGVGWVVENYHHSRYTTQPLQDALMSTFGDEQYLFGGRRQDQRSMDIKVAVTATSAAGNPVVLANYNRSCPEKKLPYSFQRPENLDAELKTWEAARATSAAPKYFKPLVHGPSKQVYTDGGIYHNNPINIADHERKLIWPANKEEEPDIIVSIGTTYCDAPNERRSIPRPYTPKGIAAHGQHLKQMAQNHIHSSFNSEKIWREYLNVRKPTPENKGRYARLNPEVAEQPPKLDAKSQMKPLQEKVRDLIADDPQIKVLAHRIVASCFFFDPESDVKEDVNVGILTVSGSFRCRFMTGFEIAALGKFIKKNSIANHDPCFIVKEEGRENDEAQEIRLTTRVVERMIHNQTFRMDSLEIRRPNRSSRTEISLCLARDSLYPISGFPRRLHAEKSTIQANRHVLTSTYSHRWAVRSMSQQQRRTDWKPPNNPPTLERSDVIGNYSDTNHLLQNFALDEPALGQPQTPDGRQWCELESTFSHAELETLTPGSEPRHITPFAELRSTASYIELPTTEIRYDCYFVASQDWQARNSNSLDLFRGDLIKILQKTNDDSWLGQRPHDEIPGWVPAFLLSPARPDAHEEYRRKELEASMWTNGRPASAN